MRLSDALEILAEVLAPQGSSDFLSQLTSGTWHRLPGGPSDARLELLGADPRETLCAAYPVATDLTYHSANAVDPAPALRGFPDAASFRAQIATFHERRYSVRFPGLRPYSNPLERVCRALEAVLHRPVTASAFWSQGGMRAPVHSDDHDLLVIQLRGRKRWHVAQGLSPLDNTWARIPGPAPTLGTNPASFDLHSGEAVYLPRGTVHAVEGEEESIHVSIGFTPLTVRDTLIAAIDHLSDLDRGWRTTASPFLAQQLQSGRIEPLPDLTRRALEALREALASPGFLAAALQRRSARAVGLLGPVSSPPAEIHLDSTLRHSARAFCHLSANDDKIDVAYPGGHLYIHRGAESGVLFMLNTATFKVRDLPGSFDDEVRLSLAQRFCDAGLLEPVTAED